MTQGCRCILQNAINIHNTQGGCCHGHLSRQGWIEQPATENLLTYRIPVVGCSSSFPSMTIQAPMVAIIYGRGGSLPWEPRAKNGHLNPICLNHIF